MSIVLDGTAGITTPEITSSGGPLVVNASAPDNSVVVDASGNVGIGKSSPAVPLHVVNASTPRIYVGSDASKFAGLVYTAGTTFGSVAIRGQGNDTGTVVHVDRDNSQVRFDTGGTERARIDSSGNLLVGTTGRLAGERLSVTTSGSGSNTCAFTFGSADDRAIVISLHAGSSGGTSRKHYAFLDGGGFERGYITVNGSGTTYATSSDYRLKENIAPMAGALSVVQQLKPCTYTWKNSGIAGQGFIAHELQEVVPECVTGEKDAVDAEGNPQYQGIDTSFLVATLTAAIQEQQALIESLTARVVALETQP